MKNLIISMFSLRVKRKASKEPFLKTNGFALNKLFKKNKNLPLYVRTVHYFSSLKYCLLP